MNADDYKQLVLAMVTGWNGDSWNMLFKKEGWKRRETGDD